jgi:hypothetical protein
VGQHVTSNDFDEEYSSEYRACLEERPELDVPALHYLAFDILAERYIADENTDGLVHLLKEQLEPYMVDLYKQPLAVLRERLGDAKSIKFVDGQLEAWFDELFDRIDKGAIDGLDEERVGHVIAFAEDYLPYRQDLPGDEADGLQQSLRLLKVNGKRPPLVEIDDPREIDNTIFWELIDEAVRFTPKTGVRCRWLKDRLTGFKSRSIVQFAKVLNREVINRYTHRNWGVAFLVNGGSSDDGFQYFLGWLLLQGRAFVEKFDVDPDIIVEKHGQEDYEEEMIYYVPEDAFYRVSNREFPESAVLKLPRKPSGKAWKQAQLPALFPRIHAAF